jgi:hypothetical protein
LAIFFLCPSKQFLPISFQIQLLEYFPQKQKEQRHKQLGYTIIEINIFNPKIFEGCVCETARLATLNPTLFKLITLIHRSSRKVQLGPGKQRGKTWFGLEKEKGN